MTKADEGIWVDRSGVQIGYESWDDSPRFREPNGRSNENFVRLNAQSKKWHDADGDRRMRLICWKEHQRSTTVDSCNGANDIVEMSVTLRGHTGTYDGIDANGQGRVQHDH